MFDNLRVSIVLPAYNEETNVEASIRSFVSHPVVDEVIAVDNNSTDGTRERILCTPARYVFEPRQGFGWALRRGLAESSGELIVLCEPDATFAASDLDKFLLYSRDFEVVFGTRTSKSCVWSGANMSWPLRVGNWVVAKFLEYLHNGPSLTDVGCTYRLLGRSVAREIVPLLEVGASHFNVELMILAIRKGFRCVEIPVQYRPRVGVSKITGSPRKAFTVGMRMILLTLKLRMRTIPRLTAGQGFRADGDATTNI